jgi:alpha-tubulin suppressor-like RCC1 family protein
MRATLLRVATAIAGGLLLAACAPSASSSPDVVPAITAITVGDYHTCAITGSGGLACWGDNSSGQIGNSKMAETLVPTEVQGLASGVAAASGGMHHTCALTSAGGVSCWGQNAGGALGNWTTADSSIPIDVWGLTSGAAAISAGSAHTCALTVNGGVKCWGRNNFGQLGDGTTTDSSTPVDVSGLASGVAAIGAGGRLSCALTTGDGVKCWGFNAGGQLGTGTTTHISSTPVDVPGLASGVAAISAGDDHACALTTAGGVRCWGENDSGQLGNGTTTASRVPVDVTGLTSGVSAIAAGCYHTCALRSGGEVMCWGQNGAGQLGDGTTTASGSPVDVSGLGSDTTRIAAGVHTCALAKDGVVRCWGFNAYGQLGDGTTTSTSLPVVADFDTP